MGAAPNSAAESLALAIRDAMRREVGDSADGPAFRARYGETAPGDITIIRDASLCARAGRAYVRGDSLPPARDTKLRWYASAAGTLQST